MPNYGKIHYPNDVAGITDGKPTHVVDRSTSYGDWTKEDEKEISSVILTAHEWEVAQKDSFKENYYIYLVDQQILLRI